MIVIIGPNQLSCKELGDQISVDSDESYVMMMMMMMMTMMMDLKVGGKEGKSDNKQKSYVNSRDDVESQLSVKMIKVS